jgi:hypothetical protein
MRARDVSAFLPSSTSLRLGSGPKRCLAILYNGNNSDVDRGHVDRENHQKKVPGKIVFADMYYKECTNPRSLVRIISFSFIYRCAPCCNDVAKGAHLGLTTKSKNQNELTRTA